MVCPKCRGPLAGDDTLRCGLCGAAFPVRDGIPRMSPGAAQEDERMAAEWEAQANAHAIYVDPAFIMNDWERAVLPSLFDWIGNVGGVVLDVGCGIGKLGASLTEIGRSDVTLLGMDFQAALLEEARTGYAARVEGDVHHLPFTDGAFSAAIASNALHHFPDANQAMIEIARVLRPGGVLVSYDPRYITPLETVKKLLRRNDTAFTKDHKAFRVDEYRELLGSSGLAVTEVRTIDPIGPLVATGLDYLKVGKLGIAPVIAKALAAADRKLVGSSGTSPFGLMLAGRAVKSAAHSA
jgi:SAM-dependent methyltransferase